jgi:transposase-like protein
VHLLRTAPGHLPGKHGGGGLRELRWLCGCCDLDDAKAGLTAWLARWLSTCPARYPRLAAWAGENNEQTLTFFRLARQHHEHLKPDNMLERLNEETRRRTYALRICPNSKSWLRLVRALAAKTRQNPPKPAKTGWRQIAPSGPLTCSKAQTGISGATPHTISRWDAAPP